MTAVFAALYLATVCWGALGQMTNNMDMMMDPTTTMAMPASSSVAPTPTPSNVPTEANFDLVGTSMMFNDTISARNAAQLNDVYNPLAGVNNVSRFNNELSRNIRRDYYFNCVEKDESGATIFPTADNLRGNVFSVYFQMPVLFYLDFEIRAGLMEALRMATGSPDLCICRHQDFRVSYFAEGVLLSVFDNSTARGAGNLNGATLRDNFMTRRTNVPGYETFLGKSAFDLGNEALYVNRIVPAPLVARDGDDGDFTVSPSQVRRHALIIVYSADYHELTDHVGTILNNAAENPNAINFYLVAGDYVFIVIGAILTFSVLVLTVIGFVVHPYFLG